MLGRTEMFSD